MSMNWRLASRLSVVTLAILVVMVVTFYQQRHITLPGTTSGNSLVTTSSSLQGTDLGSSPAPNFSLTDQFGKQVSLAEFKGKPVVLTFLYTNCPDQCPLTAEKLHATLQELGNAAPNVGVLAVSTDPARDTTSAALKFSQSHRMQDYWHYLVGPKSKLAPIWSAYSIYAQPEQQTVNHSLGLYVIDKQGHERVFLGNDFTPGQLAADLQVLLKE
jgi:protein SCO1/2